MSSNKKKFRPEINLDDLARELNTVRDAWIQVSLELKDYYSDMPSLHNAETAAKVKRMLEAIRRNGNNYR
jgi:hypothetical protein